MNTFAILGLCCALILVDLSCRQRAQNSSPQDQTQALQSQTGLQSALPSLKTGAQHFLSHEDLTANSAEVLIGQRLFRETRFSQFFYVNSSGNT